jgi:hypothetical protein
MKTYGIGQHLVSVYEAHDDRPPGAVQAIADETTTCFVDRVVDGDGSIDTKAMTEALARHSRLKIGMAGRFELQLIVSLAEAADNQPDRLKHWAAAQQKALARRLRGLFRSSDDAQPEPDRIPDI